MLIYCGLWLSPPGATVSPVAARAAAEAALLLRVHFQLPLVTSHTAPALAAWVRHELAASVTVVKGMAVPSSRGGNDGC